MTRGCREFPLSRAARLDLALAHRERPHDLAFPSGIAKLLFVLCTRGYPRGVQPWRRDR
jgi:hypothetical protein